jgi:peptidoglycan/xylan/chitin deacetylase (PgdA/CDA1 family)
MQPGADRTKGLNNELQEGLTEPVTEQAKKAESSPGDSDAARIGAASWAQPESEKFADGACGDGDHGGGHSDGQGAFDDITTPPNRADLGLSEQWERQAWTRRVGKRLLARLGAMARVCCGRNAGDGFGILAYHRISPRVRAAGTPTWNVTPQRFRAQLQGLLARGYHPWPLRKVLSQLRAGEPVPPRTFVVTFDDGFATVPLYAYPVLQVLNVPATIFLATAYLDSVEPFPFDDWAGAGSPHVPGASWRPMSTAQCWTLLQEGLVDLGTHTHTHGVFRGQPQRLYEELRCSLGVLRARFGLEQAAFSYPFGIYDAELASAVRRAGALCGLTTEQAPVALDSDPYAWGRFAPTQSDSAATLAAKLDGWYSALRLRYHRLRPRRIRAPHPSSNSASGDSKPAASCPAGATRHQPSS